MKRQPSAAIRVGGIDYLNALPLTRYLTEEGVPRLKVTSHSPAALAAGLRAGELDIALVPVVEYLAREEYAVVPGVCIASYGEVKSIRLYCRHAPSDARTVALDSSSRTSAALTRLLFKDLWRASPKFVEMAPRDAEAVFRGGAGERGPDAVLLIGDSALRTPPPAKWEALDLGLTWTRWTGLPFVYAFWVWRGGPAPGGLVERFQRARDLGLARIDDIVRESSGASGLEPQAVRHYLNRTIQYDLNAAHVEGLLEFFRRAGASLGTGRDAGLDSADASLTWVEERASQPAS